MADTKFEVILGMTFLKIKKTNVSFAKMILTWKTYTTNEILPTTDRVQIINPKEFIIAALNINGKTFMIDMAIREQEEMPVHSKKQGQVEVLLFDEALTEVLTKYFDYNDIF